MSLFSHCTTYTLPLTSRTGLRDCVTLTLFQPLISSPFSLASAHYWSSSLSWIHSCLTFAWTASSLWYGRIWGSFVACAACCRCFVVLWWQPPCLLLPCLDLLLQSASLHSELLWWPPSDSFNFDFWKQVPNPWVGSAWLTAPPMIFWK